MHGDLKPENVWLTPRTTGGFDVKVLDFGLARAGAGDATSVALRDAAPTAHGEHTTVLSWTTTPAGDRSSPMSGIAGTPAYMSPERLRGEGLSAAADLYSLGVLAYRVLTGGLPSSDETPSTARERLAAARPDVPGHALDAVTAALSPTPGDRPPSAVAFSQLLSGRTGSAASSTDRPFTSEVSMFLEGLWRDVLYGARMLWQKRSYSAIGVLTLALGIGANTAIFSVVNTVLLKPLPFDAPDRIMALGQQTTQNRAALTQFSFRNFDDLRQQSQSFDRLAAYYNLNLTLTGDREAQLLRGTVATADLFPLLGVSPILGRTFLPEEDAAGGGPGGRPAILSWQTWQEHFGGDAGVIGRAVELNNSRFTIVGVMPAGFRFPIQPQPTEVWISTALDNERPAGPGAIMLARGYRGWRAIGRLKPGVTVEQAQSEAGVIAAGLAAQFPEENKDMGIGVRPLHESIVGNLRPTLLLLLGAVAFVLLIACVNVANLLLERAISRQREIKVRLALGASGARIIRQLLTESVLLAGLGGIAGMMLAYWGTDLIVALSPESLARVAETELDLRVLGFTALDLIGDRHHLWTRAGAAHRQHQPRRVAQRGQARRHRQRADQSHAQPAGGGRSRPRAGAAGRRGPADQQLRPVAAGRAGVRSEPDAGLQRGAVGQPHVDAAADRRVLPRADRAAQRRCPGWSTPAWSFNCRSPAAAPPRASRSRAAPSIPPIGRRSSSTWPARSTSRRWAFRS